MIHLNLINFIYTVKEFVHVKISYNYRRVNTENSNNTVVSDLGNNFTIIDNNPSENTSDNTKDNTTRPL